MYVCIKAPNNKHFVTAEGNKKSVNANRPRCRGWEKFLIIAANKKSRIINSGDKVYIKTYHQRYWSAQRNGTLEANRTKLGAWEFFKIVKVSGSKGKRINYGDKVGFLPIRLTPMTATCRVPPLSRVKLGIGWSRGVARDAEQ